MKNTFRIFLTLLTFVFTQCASDFEQPSIPTGTTIAQLAASNANLNILNEALLKTNLGSSLGNINSGIFTVFAPTDDAFVAFFNALPSTLVLPPGSPAAGTFTEESVITLIRNLQLSYPAPVPPFASGVGYFTLGSLTSLLNYHVVGSSITSASISGPRTFNMFNGNRLAVSRVGTEIFLNADISVGGARVTTADGLAVNGVVHVISRVMFPTIQLSSLQTLGFTHTTGATATLPVSYTTNPPTINGGTTADANLNNYNLLAAGLRVTGLAPVLFPNTSPLPDFTIFAPTDQAFITHLGVANEAAGLAAINGLSGQALVDLGNILRYHVLSGRRVSSDITNGQQAATLLAGKSLTYGVSGSNITVDDVNVASPANVTSANILSNTGVVHRIDRVLLPN